jgi:hypothetical protein
LYRERRHRDYGIACRLTVFRGLDVIAEHSSGHIAQVGRGQNRLNLEPKVGAFRNIVVECKRLDRVELG